MYAVVRTGGKQVRVEPGDVVSVELLEGEPGQRIELTDVLLVGGEGDLKVGTPTVEGAKVLAEIEGESKPGCVAEMLTRLIDAKPEQELLVLVGLGAEIEDLLYSFRWDKRPSR